MKVALLVQARMRSTRLPGKVLKPVLGKPLLEHMLERLARVRGADQLAVVTTIHEADEPIISLCRRLEVAFFRGPEEDVLARYHAGAESLGADVVVRVTADCPLIDPAVVDRVISFYRANAARYDYVANNLVSTYPPGMDVEIFPFQVLDEAFREAQTPPEREHVTPFIYGHPERYMLANVAYDSDQSRHRWTVDAPEDFELVRLILEALYPGRPQFTLEDALDLAARHPQWSSINAMVRQKPL